MSCTLREIIWVLDQESVKARAFGIRVPGMLFRIREDLDSHTLNWQFKIDSEQLMVQPFQALQIVRIIQEDTNNALKYAGAAQGTLKMTAQKIGFYLRL